MGIKLKDKIRILRESRGYSQEWVANKLNLTQQGYCALEKNPENATIKRLKELSKILDVNLSVLIEGSDIDSDTESHSNSTAVVQGAQFVFLTDSEKDIYERFISELKNEIRYLKNKI